MQQMGQRTNKRLKTEAQVTKKLSLIDNPVTRGRGGAKQKSDSCRDQETTSHTTRIQEKLEERTNQLNKTKQKKTKKRWLQRSKQRCTFTHWSFTKIKSASEEPVNWTAGLEQQPAQHVEFVRVEGDWL